MSGPSARGRHRLIRWLLAAYHLVRARLGKPPPAPAADPAAEPVRLTGEELEQRESGGGIATAAVAVVVVPVGAAAMCGSPVAGRPGLPAAVAPAPAPTPAAPDFVLAPAIPTTWAAAVGGALLALKAGQVWAEREPGLMSVMVRSRRLAAEGGSGRLYR